MQCLRSYSNAILSTTAERMRDLRIQECLRCLFLVSIESMCLYAHEVNQYGVDRKNSVFHLTFLVCCSLKNECTILKTKRLTNREYNFNCKEVQKLSVFLVYLNLKVFVVWVKSQLVRLVP